jgi:hypothetical protein
MKFRPIECEEVDGWDAVEALALVAAEILSTGCISALSNGCLDVQDHKSWKGYAARDCISL